MVVSGNLEVLDLQNFRKIAAFDMAFTANISLNTIWSVILGSSSSQCYAGIFAH
jgi:hypothetical protein